jgi:PAS domain S-box-containing protein
VSADGADGLTAGAIYRSGWKPVAIAGGAGAAATAAFAAITGFQIGGHGFVAALDDIGVATAAGLAAASCAWTASRSEGRLRRAWTLIAAAAAAWAIGRVVVSVYELGLGVAPPTPSLADVAFMATVPLAVAGVLSFWSTPLGATERTRVWIDGLIIFLSLTFTAWALGFEQVDVGPGVSVGDRVSVLAYPLGLFLIATMVSLVINRGARHQLGSLMVLLGAVAVGGMAYLVGAYADVQGFGATRASTDAGWVVAFLLIVIASRWPARPDDRAAGRTDIWQLALPWIAVVLAALSALFLVLRGESLDRFLTLLTATLGLLLAASQILAHRDSISMLAKSRLSQETLASVIVNAPFAISRTNANFKLIDANPAMASMFLTPLEKLIGTTIASRVRHEARPGVLEQLGRLARGEVDSAEGVVPSLRSDGTLIWVHWNSTVVRKASGELDYILTMLQDVTARRERGEAAQANLSALERLDRVKSEFLKSVSHEFRTALIGIQGFSELLTDSKDLDLDEIRGFAADIRKGAERLNGMVSEILDLDRIETGRTTMRVEPVDLNAMVRQEVDELEKASNGIEFNTNLDVAVPAVGGDKDKLSEVVRTLLDNAVKSSPDGGTITVSTGVSLGEVVVNVRDQGAGASLDFDDRPFTHQDLFSDHPIRKVVGTSLGLSIARQIVEMHDGHLWMERLEGKGIEFHFTIPVAPAARVTQDPKPTEPVGKTVKGRPPTSRVAKKQPAVH